MIFSDWGDHFGNPAGEPAESYYDSPALCIQMFKNTNPTWRWGVANCDGHDIDNEIVCEKTSEGMTKFPVIFQIPQIMFDENGQFLSQ